MSRKLWLSSISIAATAALLGVGAFASYSDSERSATASVTAGTLNLEVGGSAVGEDYSVTNAYPGYKSGTGNGFVLSNTGTIDGNLRVFLVKDFDDENSLVEPETDVSDPGVGGEIDEYMTITVDDNSFGLGLAGVGEKVEITNSIWPAGEAPKLLAANGQYPAAPLELWFGYEISDTADNSIMTDTLGFHLEFTLEQVPAVTSATVVEPTKVDQAFVSPGVASPGGVTIPTVVGVDYYLDGVLSAGGFHELAPGVYAVTAAAQPDFELVGYPAGGWSLEVLAADVIVEVITGTPTKVDETAVGAGGGINIPLTVGVDYLIDGLVVPGGFNSLAAGDYLVTAEPQFGYALAGQTSWPLTVTAYVNPVTMTLTGSTIKLGSYTAGVTPVVDNVAQTITWTVPVNSAAPPTACPSFYCAYGMFTPTPEIEMGRYTTATSVPSDVNVFASATLNGALAGQESKFKLGFRNSVTGTNFQVLGTLPVSNLNLESTPWNAAVGGHHHTDKGVGVNWAGVTGTGSVTITLSFTATPL